MRLCGLFMSRAWIPNFLSLSRIGLTPFLMVLLLWGYWWQCFALFCYGAISDGLDGLLARLLKCESKFGRLMDSLSDKVMMIGVWIGLIMVDILGFVGMMLVVVMMIRDVGIMVWRLAGDSGVQDKLTVTFLAKTKTTFQMVSTGLLIVSPVTPPVVELVGYGGLWIAAILTVMTGLTYLTRGLG